MRAACAEPFTDSVSVLDVGTGSGLLALLAAKNGALHVTAVEAECAVADVARQNIAANGLSASVQVLNAHFDGHLRPPAKRADVVVAEDSLRPKYRALILQTVP